MKYNLFIYHWAILILSLTFLGACGKQSKISALDKLGVVAERKTVNNSELISCDITKLKDTVDIPLSYFIEDLQMVKLDNRDEALVGLSLATITDKHILMRNNRQNPFKLFNLKGEFLTTIGSYGQGPNEYLNVYDEWLDEASEQILILPWTSNRILRFDLQNNALEPIPLRYRVPKGKFFVDTKNSTLSVFLLPFAGSNPVVAWTQDFQGNMIDSISSENLAVHPDFSNEVFSNRNTNQFDCFLFTFFEQRPDSLYHYNIAENKLDPKFTLDFKDRKWKIHSYQELPLHFMGNVTVEKKLSDNLSITEEPSNFIVDKETLKGGFYKLYNDFLGDMPVEWPSFHNGYYVWNVEPGTLAEKLSKQLNENSTITDKERKRLTTLINSIDENENNYIFYGKLKKSKDKTFNADIRIKQRSTTEINSENTSSQQTGLSQYNEDNDNSDDDEIYMDLNDIKETPTLPNAKEYFRNNNKYKDWDIKNKKEVVLRYVVEKNGKASNIQVRKSSGNDNLDNEAVRLIEEATFLNGTNLEGNPIRCGNNAIIVFFPPQ